METNQKCKFDTGSYCEYSFIVYCARQDIKNDEQVKKYESLRNIFKHIRFYAMLWSEKLAEGNPENDEFHTVKIYHYNYCIYTAENQSCQEVEQFMLLTIPRSDKIKNVIAKYSNLLNPSVPYPYKILEQPSASASQLIEQIILTRPIPSQHSIVSNPGYQTSHHVTGARRSTSSPHAHTTISGLLPTLKSETQIRNKRKKFTPKKTPSNFNLQHTEILPQLSQSSIYGESAAGISDLSTGRRGTNRSQSSTTGVEAHSRQSRIVPYTTSSTSIVSGYLPRVPSHRSRIIYRGVNRVRGLYSHESPTHPSTHTQE